MPHIMLGLAFGGHIYMEGPRARHISNMSKIFRLRRAAILAGSDSMPELPVPRLGVRMTVMMVLLALAVSRRPHTHQSNT